MGIKDLFPSHARGPVAAASLRAPLRGEILPITVTQASKRFAVPAAWRNHLVRIQADGGDLYLQLSTANDAGVDAGARATEVNNGGTITLTAPTGANTGAIKIPDGTWQDVPFPDVAGGTFALVGSATCVARCHLSES